MGTSKSSSGPSGGIPLLPDWVDDQEGQDGNDNHNEENQNGEDSPKDDQKEERRPKTESWRPVRTAFTSYLKNPTKKKLGNTLGKYVKGTGGSKKISSSVISGKSTGARFGGFLSDIVEKGSSEALKILGVGDIEGKSAEYVFTKLAELLSPKGNEADDPYARSAISETLATIYEELEEDEKSIDDLESLTPEIANGYMVTYIGTYIYQRLMAELGKSLVERSDYSEKQLIDREYEIKEYIQETLKIEFKDSDLTKVDFSSPEGKEKIDEIFNDAYSILEDL
ncbi:MAG: Qat anti-phage system associated protein QatB [Bacteroidales bacterium]